MNDRYFDLAIAANFFVTREADEDPYLAATRDRVSPRALLSHAMLAPSVVLRDLVADRVTRRWRCPDQPTPDLRVFHDGLIAGTIELADSAHKLQYANANLEAARRAMQSPHSATALALMR